MGASAGDCLGGLAAVLGADEIAGLLEPYAGTGDGFSGINWLDICGQLACYLELILKWNARTNLTAIREPEEIVRRHFGESLFAGLHVGQCATLLDFGSGAGFPGIPVALVRPDVRVTLAESQGKKAAFLREVVRELRLETEVWAGRVEEMEPGRQFDVVAMRAVDKMEVATLKAAVRARRRVMVLGTTGSVDGLKFEGFERVDLWGLPGSRDGVLLVVGRS